MSRVNRTPTAALVALALAAALSLGACNDDEKKNDDPPSSAPPSSGTTSPSDPPTSEPTEPATPLGTGAAPATGQEISLDALSVRIPKGWQLVSQDIEGFIARPKGLTLDYLTVDFITNDGVPTSVEQALREANRSDSFAKDPPMILPPVEVDGVPMYHRSGKVSRTTWLESFGSNSTAYTVSITFELQPFDRTVKQQRELADSVLATVDLVE